MFTRTSFIIVFLIATAHSQSLPVQFPSFPVNTEYGICTCDLTQSKCDSSCCCDTDCSAGDQQAFRCSTRSNQYTNATPVLSTIQSTCYKNTSIFKADTPYVLQKMGELVCIDFSRYTGSQYYQQPTTSSLNGGFFIRSLDTKYSVAAPESLSTDLTNYQVGSSIYSRSSTRTLPGFFSLPVKLFNNPMCSGSQTITYMKDFTSKCLQLVNSATCTKDLNPATYGNQSCLIRSPSKLSDTTADACDNSIVTTSSLDGTNTYCINALISLNIQVFYSNPTGIISVNITPGFDNVTVSSTIEQTFTVKFIQTSVPSSAAANATRSPGYRKGDNIWTLTLNGSTINTISSSNFPILQPASDGSCSSSVTRKQIGFGENLRLTCKFGTTGTTSSCPVWGSFFTPTTYANLYVAAYRNSDTTNITSEWLPVIHCISDAGSPNTRQCYKEFPSSNTLDSLCYIKLDIEIAYTKIGSVYNPQPVISAVIFYYQTISTSSFPLSLPFFFTESVTFQDISSSPTLEYGEIPVPDVRLPADFFYPFSASHATKPMTNSLFLSLLIGILFILM